MRLCPRFGCLSLSLVSYVLGYGWECSECLWTMIGVLDVGVAFG